METRINKTNKTINYDLIELIYTFNEELINYLERPNTTHNIIKIHSNQYLINDIFKINIWRKPSDTFKSEDLVYIKLENKILYSSLKSALIFIKSFMRERSCIFKAVKSLDICLDIEDDFLFNKMDLNNLQNYTTSTKDGISFTNLNTLNGKTLYFNTPKVGKRQKFTAIVYQKDKEIIRSKKRYQNPDNKIITRVELKFRKLGGDRRENILLMAIGELINNDLETFIDHKNILVQWIFKQWHYGYHLKSVDGMILLDYDMIFDDSIDTNPINNFITIFSNDINMVNKKSSDRKRERYIRKEDIKSKDKYISILEDLKVSYLTIFKKTSTVDNYILLLEEQLIFNDILDNGPDYYTLDKIKFKEKSINGNKIKESIHNYILFLFRSRLNIKSELSRPIYNSLIIN